MKSGQIHTPLLYPSQAQKLEAETRFLKQNRTSYTSHFLQYLGLRGPSHCNDALVFHGIHAEVSDGVGKGAGATQALLPHARNLCTAHMSAQAAPPLTLLKLESVYCPPFSARLSTKL